MCPSQSLNTIFAVAPFYPNLRFTMSSLSLLEAAGMPVLSSLSKLIEARALPLTWQSLFGVMTDMGLEDLSQEIVNYFYGMCVWSNYVS